MWIQPAAVRLPAPRKYLDGYAPVDDATAGAPAVNENSPQVPSNVRAGFLRAEMRLKQQLMRISRPQLFETAADAMKSPHSSHQLLIQTGLAVGDRISC